MKQGWLILDSNRRRIGLAADFGADIAWSAAGDRDKGYVNSVQEAIANALLKVTDIRHITVVQGTGGFSDTRAAVLFATMVAWQQEGTKLFEITETPGQPLQIIETGEEYAKLSKAVTELKPRYFAEPNITNSNKT